MHMTDPRNIKLQKTTLTMQWNPTLLTPLLLHAVGCLGPGHTHLMSVSILMGFKLSVVKPVCRTGMTFFFLHLIFIFFSASSSFDVTWVMGKKRTD